MSRRADTPTASSTVDRILRYVEVAGRFTGKGKQRTLMLQGTMDLSGDSGAIKDGTKWMEEWVEEYAAAKVEEALEGSQTIRQDAAMLSVTPDHLFAETKRQVAIQWDEMKRLEQTNKQLEAELEARLKD